MEHIIKELREGLFCFADLDIYFQDNNIELPQSISNQFMAGKSHITAAITQLHKLHDQARKEQKEANPLLKG